MTRTLVALWAAIQLHAVAAAGVVLEFEVIESSAPAAGGEATASKRKITLHISDQGEIAIHDPVEKSRVLYHDGKATIVNDRDRSYFVVDKAAIDRMKQLRAGRDDPRIAAGLRARITAMEQRLAAMNEAERRQMGPQLKAAIEAAKNQLAELEARQAAAQERKPRIERAGSARVGEYDTSRYIVTAGGKRKTEVFTVPFERVNVRRAELDALKKLSGFLGEMARATGGGGSTGGGWELFDDLDGFPVLMREYEGATKQGETWLRGAARRTIHPAAFVPPDGYKKRSTGPR